MNNPSLFEHFLFWLGFLFLLVCASAIFYDCVYKPVKDKIIVRWRLIKLDLRLSIENYPRLAALLDSDRAIAVTLGLLTIAGVLIGYLIFRVVFMGSLL